MFIIKKFQSTAVLFVALISLLAFASCSKTDGCTIEGKCTASQYTSAVLSQLDGSVIDSLTLDNGKFRFCLDQTVTDPYITNVYLLNPADVEDFVVIPVAVENGIVNINYGDEYFTISGTSLNKQIMTFYNGLSRLQDKVTNPENGIAPGQIVPEFSKFYLNAIAMNKSNAFGKYIYENYGSHLVGGDKEQAEKILKK